jgi:hypothetical protein
MARYFSSMIGFIVEMGLKALVERTLEGGGVD